ncbi:MAG: Gfo/Idh/MocA family oxidoreductase [Kiritimatiellia bacterium]
MKRRDFIKTVSAGVGGMSVMGASAQKSTVTKPLRVALIGCGGYGTFAHIPAILGQVTISNSPDGKHAHQPETDGERLVAVVDPNKRRIAGAMARVKKIVPGFDTSKIRKYADYRIMFDEMGDELDAVIIATPIHQHALPALMAIRRRIHVYLEKPLAHTIAEVRMITEEARKYGVVTQMGNWGQSTEGPRLLREYYDAGAIGDIREVHCWSDRVDGLPPGTPRPPALPVPEGLAWDLWLGGAPHRDFHKGLLNFYWNAWRDFGNATLGNMGCHIINHAYWALNLAKPSAVELEEVYGGTKESWPIRNRIRWDFPARGNMPPMKLYWYDGIKPGSPYNKETVGGGGHRRMARQHAYAPPIRTELEKKYDRQFTGEGSLFIGDKGVFTMGRHGDGFRMVPESAHRAFKKPPKTLPRVKGTHQEDFFRACRGGTPASSNFDHAGPLTELVLLGNIAVYAGTGKRIEWDSDKMRCTNMPEINRYLQTSYQKGWEI